MGDLLSKEMLADLAINLINIVILFFLTKFLLYKPVKKYLDGRKAAAAEQKAQAERAQLEAAAAKQAYDAKLAEVNGGAEQLLSASRAEAEQAAGEIVSAAEKQAAELLSRAQADADAVKAEALENAREEIGAAAVEIAEKILRREVSDRDDRRLVDAFFAAEEGQGAQ